MTPLAVADAIRSAATAYGRELKKQMRVAGAVTPGFQTHAKERAYFRVARALGHDGLRDVQARLRAALEDELEKVGCWS